MRRFLQKRYLILIIGAIVTFGILRQFGPLKPQMKKIAEEIPFSQEINLVSASGKVEAKNVANLTFQTSGLLSWVGVKEGDYVQKWQGIASLDKQDLEKRLTRSLNLYLANRWDFEQTQDNFKDKKDRFLLTDADRRILDKAQFSLNNAVIEVELADLVARLATISTPISGIVIRVDTPSAGVNITPATTFTIIDPTSVFFQANVDEADIGQIKIGQEVKIALDSYPGEEFKGRVEKIGFVAQPTAGGGRAFLVEISLPQNNDLKFKIGMNGDADILLK